MDDVLAAPFGPVPAAAQVWLRGSPCSRVAGTSPTCRLCQPDLTSPRGTVPPLCCVLCPCVMSPQHVLCPCSMSCVPTARHVSLCPSTATRVGRGCRGCRGCSLGAQPGLCVVTASQGRCGFVSTPGCVRDRGALQLQTLWGPRGSGQVGDPCREGSGLTRRHGATLPPAPRPPVSQAKTEEQIAAEEAWYETDKVWLVHKDGFSLSELGSGQAVGFARHGPAEPRVPSQAASCGRRRPAPCPRAR